MNIKNHAAVVVAAFAFAAPLAHAQAPAPAPVAVDQKTVAAVEDLLRATKYREMMTQILKQTTAQLPQMIRAEAAQRIRNTPNLSDKQRKEALAEADSKLAGMAKEVRDVLEDPKLVDEMADAMPALYARHFTYAEVVEIAKFYKTPLGAKTLKVMPVLSAELMQASQQIVAPRVEAMQRRMMQTVLGGAQKQGK